MMPARRLSWAVAAAAAAHSNSSTVIFAVVQVLIVELLYANTAMPQQRHAVFVKTFNVCHK
jgi:hypothetical protein